MNLTDNESLKVFLGESAADITIAVELCTFAK